MLPENIELLIAFIAAFQEVMAMRHDGTGTASDSKARTTFDATENKRQIEQDQRQSRGVAAIFADEVLREHVAMRGGNVLHKAHLAPAASL
jgi:hypothetical protein